MPPVYIEFNGGLVETLTGFGQFYDTPNGMKRLHAEACEMKHLPKTFLVSLHQNRIVGDVYFKIYMPVRNVNHEVRLVYDREHPQYQINAFIDYPRLDMSRMHGHWYSDGRPCYIENWTRKWTALKVATQVRFWLEDYYKDKSSSNQNYRGYDDARVMAALMESQRIREQMKPRRFWRFW